MNVFDMQQPLNLIWDILLPAVQPDALPDDAAAQAALTQKISGLAMSPVQGNPKLPIAAQISGRTYAVDANDLKIETITLNFTGSGCVVSNKTATNEETIPCGYGEWHLGQTALFNQPLLFDSTPITASGT